jgi:8-oxo-dGTP diphosphatase
MTEVAAALCIKNGAILVARRKAGCALAGYWEFPGGKREAGETLFDCLVREIREELGADCTARQVFAEAVSRNEDGTDAAIVYGITADVSDAPFKMTAHDAFAWAALPDLLGYRLAPADRRIAELLIKDRLVSPVSPQYPDRPVTRREEMR